MSFQGIFISRVIKGGASEKAGIHVGDRLLEVDEEIFLSSSSFLLFLIKIIMNLMDKRLPYYAHFLDPNL